jgi:hypothetical protein
VSSCYIEHPKRLLDESLSGQSLHSHSAAPEIGYKVIWHKPRGHTYLCAVMAGTRDKCWAGTLADRGVKSAWMGAPFPIRGEASRHGPTATINSSLTSI